MSDRNNQLIANRIRRMSRESELKNRQSGVVIRAKVIEYRPSVRQERKQVRQALSRGDW